MASISEFSATLDGTTLYGSLSISVSSRTASSVTFSYSATLRCPNGYSAAGYEQYSGYIGISGTSITGNSASPIFKEKSTAWSPGSSATKTGTITCSTSTYANLTATVSFYFMTSIGSQASPTKTTTLTTGSGAITPTAPTTVSGKTNVSQSTSTFYIGYNPDASIALTVSGGSNVSYYERQVSVNGGGWTACNATYTPTTKTNGTTYKFRARSISSTGNASGYTTGNTITCAYRASTAPSSVSFKTGNSSTTTIYIGENPDTSLSAAVSGGTNISSYDYQYKKNSGSWTNIAAGSLNSLLSGLTSGNTLKLRVRILGLNGSYTSYTESNTLTVAYRASTPFTSFVISGNVGKSNEEFYMGDIVDTAVEGVTFGGTNISSVQYQYKKNSDSWTACTLPLLNATWSPAEGDTIQLRARILGLNGSYTAYTESNSLTVAAMRLPGFYVTYNGVQQYITDEHFKLKCAGNIMQTDVEIEFVSNWKAPVQDGDVLHIS